VITCATDKDSVKQTLSCDSDFCFTHLYGYRNFLGSNKECDTNNEEELKVTVFLFLCVFFRARNANL